MRDYLRRVLSQRYHVHAVADGEAAWSFARKNPVDLVLSDVMMPRMDGFELLRELRSDGRTKTIPIILLSARAGEESRVEGLAAGADDYLTKPFTVRELLARVDAHLKLARLRRESVNLQESELRFRTMADCAPAMIWTCGVDRQCDYFNTGWREFTGAAESSGWLECVHPDDRAHSIALVESAFSRRARLDLEFRVRRNDGAYHWMSCSVAPRFIPGGAYLGFVFCCVDTQDRRELEQRIHQLNADLEKRVLERTTQLEAANKELEAFAYSVSHDLRAPLRGIDGWSMALAEDYAAHLDDRGRQYIHRVRSEAQRMGLLIDALLGLSRIARAEMQTNAIDISSIARSVSAKFQEAEPGRRIEFIIGPDLRAAGDARLIEIVLTNLLSNAVKFTGLRAQARIEFGQAKCAGESCFYVRDDGVGFDMRYAGTLFGAFKRLHKASEFPGTGIGLATVRRIVERHGGRVWAEAAPGSGATFYFTLHGGA
jgi:PAS domain S-box-containing protein